MLLKCGSIATCGGIAIFIGQGFGLPLTGWLSDRLTPVYGAASIGYALSVIIPAAALVGLASHGAVLRRLAAAPTDKSPS